MFPRHFKWKTRRTSWSPSATLRGRNPRSEEEAYDFRGIVAKEFVLIYAVGSRECERYFLRLLVTQVPEQNLWKTCHISKSSRAPASDKLSYDFFCWLTMKIGSTQSNNHSGKASFCFLISLLQFWYTASPQILSRCGTTTWTCFPRKVAMAHLDNPFEDRSFAMITTPHLTCL